MRYHYKGFWGCDSCCDIEAHRRGDGKYVFIATELPDNPGTSVTNCAWHLATAMRRQYGLNAEEVIWIEHYPEAKHRRKEDFDLVRFVAMEGESFRSPVWTRITEEAVEELIAGVRSVEDLRMRGVSCPASHPLSSGATQGVLLTVLRSNRLGAASGRS